MIQIGKSTVLAEPLGLGTNKVGGYNLFPHLNDQKGRDVVKTALDNGINMIDTAFVYGYGHSEELIGQVLKDFPRDKVVVATKGAHYIESSGLVVRRNDPAFLRETLEASLKRLNLDYVDIFYIHFPDGVTPPIEAVEELTKLKKEGKLRAIGLSNFDLDQIKAANITGQIDIVENRYNLFQREPEAKLLPYLMQQQITFVPYEPFAESLLTGRYLDPQNPPRFDFSDHRQKNFLFLPEQVPGNIEKVAKLQPIAARYNTSIAALVLAWYLKHPLIGAVIPGARTPEQVLSNVQARDIDLSNADFETIDGIFK
ncbi:aldo/keto reductase [Lacticaseibacillus saniviri]